MVRNRYINIQTDFEASLLVRSLSHFALCPFFLWLLQHEPLLQTTPLQAAGGNHEIECDNITHEIFVPYENYFRNSNRIAPADMLPVSDDYRKTLWHEQCTTSGEFLGRSNATHAKFNWVRDGTTSEGTRDSVWLENQYFQK
jgi:hypothetical protein